MTGCESPDFVFWIKGRDRKAVLGVEHFSAHHFSEQYKDGKTVGTNQYSWDDELKRYRVYDEPIIPKEKEKCIKAAIEKTTVNMFNAKYHMLCKALEQGLYNHSKKIDDYKKNIIDRLGAGVDIEIAFMIDISTEFDSCIVYNGKEGRRITKTFVPMFRDIVDILSQIDSAKVDYIFIRFNKLGNINIFCQKHFSKYV